MFLAAISLQKICFISPISRLPNICPKYQQNDYTDPIFLTRSFSLFLSLSEISMKCISSCEKHLLVGHINKAEKGKCLNDIPLVTHLPRKPKMHRSCGCNGGHHDSPSWVTMALSLLKLNFRKYPAINTHYS